MEESMEFEFKQTGCVYNWIGIICKDRTKCETCGWNPTVEEKRKETVIEKYGEVLRCGLGRV